MLLRQLVAKGSEKDFVFGRPRGRDPQPGRQVVNQVLRRDVAEALIGVVAALYAELLAAEGEGLLRSMDFLVLTETHSDPGAVLGATRRYDSFCQGCHVTALCLLPQRVRELAILDSTAALPTN